MNAKTDIWMPLYIGDYLADTVMLNAEQSGCYLHWLMAYWRTGPLEDDLPALIQMGKLTSQDAPNIAKSILERFFTKNGDGHWHQKRLDEEIAYAVSMKQARSKGGASRAQALNSEKKSEIARLGAEKRWGKKKTKDLDACSMLAESLQNACPSPLPLQVSKSYSSKDVENLYWAYPRHVGKAAALKVIEKVLKQGHDPNWLLERVNRYSELRAKEDPQFTPHPATWFNEGRYFDDEVQPKEQQLWVDAEAVQ